MSKQFESFMTSFAIIYPGVSVWVADGKLCSNYSGKDKDIFLDTMATVIMEFCK